jgi:hypothetical protein
MSSRCRGVSKEDNGHTLFDIPLIIVFFFLFSNLRKATFFFIISLFNNADTPYYIYMYFIFHILFSKFILHSYTPHLIKKALVVIFIYNLCSCSVPDIV